MEENHGGLPSLDGLTQPERWAALLEAFSVPGYDGVYVLGCFARRVTFYSQQVRALNLVDALIHGGRVTGKRRVAVIGAGVAGLTAAAGLLRRGACVTVFEKVADPAKNEGRMPLQQATKQRVVHPHIYDWPAENATQLQAGLPVLEWNAGPAHQVINQISEKFAEIAKDHDDRIEFHRANDVAIAKSPVTVRWNGRSEAFEAVILAVGFGREGEDTGWHSYWDDDNIEGPDAVGGRWLISGSGDGALTDLMRLIISPFDHQKLLEEFSEAVPADVRKKLVKADRSGASGQELSKIFREAAAEVKFDLELRTIDVWLNCTEAKLFGPESSILNRLIAAFLLQHPDGRVHLVDTPQHITKPKRVKGGWSVQPKVMNKRGVFDKVIVRHGPARAIRAFEDVWTACDPKFKQWQDSKPGADWTRVPMWGNGAFDPATVVPLAPDVETKASCLVVVANEEEAERTLNGVTEALDRAITDGVKVGALAIDPNPVVINVEKALSDPTLYAYAVRAICACPLAVFDVTDAQSEQPGTALLLGIRAATRRGVTVTVIRDKLDAKTWSALPFNIREVGVVSDAKSKQFIDDVHGALKDGIKLLESVGEHYRDLPVYDAVRRLGSSADFYRPIPPSERVLLLSWYDPRYVDTIGRTIETCLESRFRNPVTKKPPAVLRIINTPSPQMMSDKLYAEIRRARFCVADWTGWRFNVFFELGVRLAITSDEPVCVICDDKNWLAGVELPRTKAQHTALRELFAPFAFVKGDDPKLKDWFTECRKVIETRPEERAPWPGRIELPAGKMRLVPGGYTHALVRGTIRLESEPWGTPVWRRLTAMAKEIRGDGGVTVPDPPVLFADHPPRRVRRAGVEHLLAAWLYLDYQVTHADAEGLVDQRLKFADELYAVLENENLLADPQYQALIKRLDELAAEQWRNATDAIELAEAKKRAAQRKRKAGRRLEAVAFMDEAIHALETERNQLSRDEQLGERGKTLAEALADAYGTKGGILRTAGMFDESRGAYDKGYRYEGDPDYRFTSSYNLTQRLVARILAVPEHLNSDEWEDHRVVYPADFKTAVQEISQQLAGPRVNDPWAMADLALLLLVLGDVSVEQSAWLRLERATPPAFVFSSTLNVVNDLRNRIGQVLAESTSPRVTAFRSRLDSVASNLEKWSAT